MPPSRSRRRPRWPFVAIGLLTIAIATGGWLWFGRVPDYRPDLLPGERFGVDVSNHQKTIDWEAVAGDDMHFAYIKATEGGDFVDQHFRENWEGAAAAGLERGAYHFFTLCRPGSEQADNFLRTVPRDESAMAPVVDLEFGGNCSARPDREALIRELRNFIDKVEAAEGRPVVLYLLEDFEEQYRVRDEFPRAFWTRDLLHRPDRPDWLLWQVSGWARVDGIDGEADLNVMAAG